MVHIAQGLPLFHLYRVHHDIDYFLHTDVDATKSYIVVYDRRIESVDWV